MKLVDKMLVIELCRICLKVTDGDVKMYPIEHTRYLEIYERYTGDKMDMNEELPYSACDLCKAMLNKHYDFLKNMISTEIYLKEALRNTSKLTFESVEKIKTKMISKQHNQSHEKIKETTVDQDVYAKDDDQISIEEDYGLVLSPESPVSENESPNIVIEKESQEEKLTFESVEEINTEMISKQHNQSHEKIKETTADQDDYAKDDDQISIEEDYGLVLSPESPVSENESSNIVIEKESQEEKLTFESVEKISIEEDFGLVLSPESPESENNNSSEQSNHMSVSSFSYKPTKTPNPVDSFLLREEEIAKSSNENVTEEAVTTNTTNLKFIEERIPIEKEEKLTPKSLRKHLKKAISIYEPFVEQCIQNEENPPKKRLKTSEQRVDTPNPDIYQNQNLEIDYPDDQNKDDYIIMDGNVEVKIESVDEEFQGFFEENHEEDNVVFDTETFEDTEETEDIQEMYETNDEMELHEPESKKQDDTFVCSLCKKSFATEIEVGKHAIKHIL